MKSFCLNLIYDRMIYYRYIEYIFVKKIMQEQIGIIYQLLKSPKVVFFGGGGNREILVCSLFDTSTEY